MVEQFVDTSVPPGKRDLAIILLASRLGIGAGDIAAMKFSNLNFEHDRICFVQNKTGNSSDLYMLPEIKAALLDYLGNERPSSRNESVFLKAIAPHDGISYSVVSFAVKKHMQRSGIDFSKKKHGPHSLRSSLATSMVNDGIDYDSVRKILGHESENAIKHYARVDAAMLQESRYSPHCMRHTTGQHMLEAGVPLMVIKSFLGHASVQTTQIYAESSQAVVDRNIREWNEKNFPKTLYCDKLDIDRTNVPDFLMSR